jgi:nitrite reductase/ring-hydroxylating ferredoxin subunit
MSHPLKPVRSLEAHYYTDPAIYAREVDGLLSRTWQYAGHASQVEKPGDYFTFEIAGQSLFCIHGRDGVIRAFYNVCQHRAHELVSGEGNCKVVVCPYHAWSYELTGELRSGPNIKVVPGFDKREICLSEVRIENFHGFLFANLDPDAKSMDEWFPGVREELAELRAAHLAAEAAGMGGDTGSLQLEGLGRELFRVLSLLDQPPDLCHRRGETGDLRYPATRVLPAPHHTVPEPGPDELSDRPCLKPARW